MSKMCCGLFSKDDGADDSAYDNNDTALPPPTSTITVSETMAAVPAEMNDTAAAKDSSASAVTKVTIATTEAAEAAPELPASVVGAVSEAVPSPEPVLEAPSPEVVAEPTADIDAAVPVKVEEEEVAVSPPDIAVVAPTEPEPAVEESKEEPRAAAAVTQAVSAPKDDFDVEAFKAKLIKGITVTKYNRHGKSAARVLYFDEPDKTISWGEVGAGHHKRSSSLLRHVEAPLPVSSLTKVLPASKATHTFFKPTEATRSFQLVFSHRTVDITAQSDADAKYIATGMERLKATS